MDALSTLQDIQPFGKDLTLSEDAFRAWWSHIPREDRDEFKFIYSGDDYLARFVCAIDYMAINKVQAPDFESHIAIAYWIAAKQFEPNLALDSPGTRNRAMRAWKSDAVQALHDRVKYRSVQQGHIRLTNKLFALGEEMVDMAMGDDIPLKEKKHAAEVLIKISQLVDAREELIRTERTKRGLDSAREALKNTGQEYTERELIAILKAGAGKLGRDKILALLDKADAE